VGGTRDQRHHVGVEGAAGILSGSVALKADALDFLGDAANL